VGSAKRTGWGVNWKNRFDKKKIHADARIKMRKWWAEDKAAFGGAWRKTQDEQKITTRKKGKKELTPQEKLVHLSNKTERSSQKGRVTWLRRKKRCWVHLFRGVRGGGVFIRSIRRGLGKNRTGLLKKKKRW